MAESSLASYAEVAKLSTGEEHGLSTRPVLTCGDKASGWRRMPASCLAAHACVVTSGGAADWALLAHVCALLHPAHSTQLGFTAVSSR